MRLIGKCKTVDYTRQKNVYRSLKFIINNYYDMTINFKKDRTCVTKKKHKYIQRKKKIHDRLIVN